MNGSVQVSCEMEFTKEFKEYNSYDHFNFVIMASHVFNKSGVMPFPGSLSEQPAQIMEILEVIFQLDMERDEDMRRKSEKDKKKK